MGTQPSITPKASVTPAAAEPVEPVACYKCGRDLDPNPYGEKRQAVVEMASDHASKHGCDWAAKNIDELVEQFNAVPVGLRLERKTHREKLEKIEAEHAEKLERLEIERVEKQRVSQEKAFKERLVKEKAERERQEKLGNKETEAQRLERERLEKEEAALYERLGKVEKVVEKETEKERLERVERERRERSTTKDDPNRIVARDDDKKGK